MSCYAKIWENWKFRRSAFRDFKKECREHHCSCLQNRRTVESGIFRLAIQSCELRSFVVRVCRVEVQEGRRHSLSMISRDMFASLRRTDAVADDLVLSKETRRRRYERGARSQTLQPEVTTSSLLGWWLHLHWWQLPVVVAAVVDVVVVVDVAVAVAGSSGAELATSPDARRPCSSSNSWPMKFRFGLMIGRAFFTSLYASTIDKPLCRIM